VLFTIRAYDGDKPPKLRSAPMTDALNDVVRRIASGETPQVIVESSLQGVREIRIRFPSASEPAVLVRVTPEDVEVEHSRGGTLATVESIAESWRDALERALASPAAGAPAGARDDG